MAVICRGEGGGEVVLCCGEGGDEVVLCRGEGGSEVVGGRTPVRCRGGGGGALTTSEASGRTAEESGRIAGPWEVGVSNSTMAPWGRGESAAPTNPSVEEKRPTRAQLRPNRDPQWSQSVAYKQFFLQSQGTSKAHREDPRGPQPVADQCQSFAQQQDLLGLPPPYPHQRLP